MNRLTNPALILVPHELLGAVLLLIVALGGVCRIVGARKAATSLIATAIGVPIATVVVEALFSELFSVLPPRLVQLAAWLVLTVVYIAILGMLMSISAILSRLLTVG